MGSEPTKPSEYSPIVKQVCQERDAARRDANVQRSVNRDLVTKIRQFMHTGEIPMELFESECAASDALGEEPDLAREEAREWEQLAHEAKAKLDRAVAMLANAFRYAANDAWRSDALMLLKSFGREPQWSQDPATQSDEVRKLRAEVQRLTKAITDAHHAFHGHGGDGVSVAERVTVVLAELAPLRKLAEAAKNLQGAVLGLSEATEEWCWCCACSREHRDPLCEITEQANREFKEALEAWEASRDE